MTRRGSLRWRITLVVMTTTAAALLLSATSLLIYELRSYRNAWAADLTTQADLIASSTAAALAFDDARAANEVLALLRLRPQIEAAAVYSAAGQLFASYAEPGVSPLALPVVLRPDGARVEGDRLELFQKVEQNNQRVGTVYLAAHYDVGGRLRDYVVILFAVTLASLALAALVFSSLESTLTQPILALAQVARDVVRRRDYRLKVAKTTDDEVGVLVDSFNDMLHDLDVEMSQRQKAEDALRVADRRKDEFLATLAHELRNPLAPLVTSLEVLRRADADPAAQARARELMGRQLKQMVRLIDDLLDVSRITTNKLQLRRDVLDLVTIVHDAIEVAEPALRERNQALQTTWPDGAVWVEGDATRLTQVVVNLLNNAVKYTDRGGRIAVALQAADGSATVRVRDNGIGIDPAQQTEIFGMFMQVDRSLERERAGLGVGLSLAKRLVELHGGTIGVDSAGRGQGSEFTVTVPTVAAPTRRADRPKVAPPLSDGALRILVADDNVDLATSLGDMLGALGHSVRVVHDGRAALAAAIEAPPDIALFDIGMPLLNGYDLAQRLRAEPSTRHLPMVAITGWGQDTDRARARAAGFDRHLVKPVDPEELTEVLRSLGQRAAGAAVAPS